MKPFSIYHLFYESFTTGQQQLLQQMQEMADPDMVYLLGASKYTRRTESIFNTDTPSAIKPGGCFYLLLLPADSNKTLRQWEDQLEHAVDSPAFSIMAFHSSRFKEWVQQGHAFACKVQAEAVVLYQKPGYETGPAGKAAESTMPAGKNNPEKAIAMACSFFSGAQFYPW